MDQKPPTQEQQQQQQLAAAIQKCPRCESTNTKFCYFNNYSLTQPRHFCKACKRYWTKGGTLRNVPVGGGCRKNKGTKRPCTNTTTTLPIHIHNKDPPQPFSSKTTNPMLYGLPIHNYPENDDHLDNFHFQQQHHMTAGGLGFSSSGFVSNDDYRNPLLSSYGSLFGSSPPSTTTTSPHPTTISTSSQKFMPSYQYKSLFPFQNMHLIATNNGESGGEINGVKVEGAQPNTMYNWDRGIPSSSHHNQIHQIDSSSHHNNPSLHSWNNNTTTNWPDLTNIGSSVTSSLI